jgi:rfaE bifunctional protein nucleotidyltransferase chain/domain
MSLQQIQHKIVTLEEAKIRVQNFKGQNEQVVFTNGCFDILHKGHVTYLAKAAEEGNRLILGLNSDDSVRRLGKDTNRPINDEASRALVIASLQFIDLVIVFDEDTPFDLIKELHPNILVKGGDYNANQKDPNQKDYIIGSDIVKKNGGTVRTINLVDGFSTSNIISKIKS